MFAFNLAQVCDERVDIIIDGEVTDSSFGHTIVVGDVNGDGHNDLIIGANKYDNYRGGAYLYYGGDSFDTIVDKTFTGEGTNDVFSHQISLADVDGDNCDDLLVGTRFYPDLSTGNRGRAYLYFGDPGSTMDEICDVIFDGEHRGDNFASAIDLFDIDNDGHTDVIIGARRYNRGQGRGYLYWGSSRATMDNVVDRVFDGEAGVKSNMGGDTVYCGYVNNDKYGDIIFSGYAYDKGRGRAYLYYGDTKASMNDVCDHTFTGEVSWSWPMRVRVADFDGDNCGDVAIGG